MEYLKPVKLRKAYYSRIEATINRLFYQICFAPLLEAFKRNNKQVKQLTNAKDAIEDTLRSGKIFYYQGKFGGKFNAAISKQFIELGAVFDGRSKTWSFPKLTPPEIQMIVADVKMKDEQLRADMIRNLDSINMDQIIANAPLVPEYHHTVKQINHDFLESIKGVSIAPELTPAVSLALSKAWASNLELYIQKWSKENIYKLRDEIATNTYRGKRAENLVKNIQADYGVSKRKAKFLARQETSLLVSQMRQERFTDAGVLSYKWSTSGDERVRPSKGANGFYGDHRVLEGKIFTWDNPPIVDPSTGRRAHPGEDYNCRCIAIPIVK